MDKERYAQILQYPSDLTEANTNELAKLISSYPYFQSARALYLKGLKNQESFKYNQELKTTAAYTTDRSILFDYITSKTFNQNEISQQIKQNLDYLKSLEVNDAEDISVDKSIFIANALKQQLQETEGVLDPDLFEKKTEEVSQASKEPLLNVDSENITERPEEILQIGKPLEFDKSETHSFSEWLKITSFKPINRSKAEPLKKAPLENKLKQIDRFLESNPKISPVKSKTSSQETKISKDIVLEPKSQDGYMTETLARIYLEQKNYEKAIQSYKILSLKYPEKSGFFADQIKAVKELQDINKTEK